MCGISGDLAPSTRKSLAIAIVQFWGAKFGGDFLGQRGGGAQPRPSSRPMGNGPSWCAFVRSMWRLVMYCVSFCKCMNLSILSWSLSALCLVLVLLCYFVACLVPKGRLSALSGPVLRDTARLSQRYPPIARYGVFGVSTWPIGCDTPSLFSERFPLWEHTKWRCDTPPQKGYLSDTCAKTFENKANGCDTPLCDTISKGYCAIWGGISHWAAKWVLGQILRGLSYIPASYSVLAFSGAVPWAGGFSDPSVLRSPETTPLRCGAAHGPLRPALCSSPSLQSFVFFCLARPFVGSCLFGGCVVLWGRNAHVLGLVPFRFWPLNCTDLVSSLAPIVSLSPWVGCIVATTFRFWWLWWGRLTPGEESFVLVFLLLFCLSTVWGPLAPATTRAGWAHLATAQQVAQRLHQGVASPPPPPSPPPPSFHPLFFFSCFLA